MKITKKDYKKGLVKDVKVFLQKKREKKVAIVVKDTENLLEDEKLIRYRKKYKLRKNALL